jgi:hypothetical protein
MGEFGGSLPASIYGLWDYAEYVMPMVAGMAYGMPGGRPDFHMVIRNTGTWTQYKLVSDPIGSQTFAHIRETLARRLLAQVYIVPTNRIQASTLPPPTKERAGALIKARFRCFVPID